MKLIKKIFRKVKGLIANKRINSICCEVSRSCDLRCRQCANHSIYTEPPQGNLLLTPEIFSKLIPILPYSCLINFDNHGEPLFNPHLEEYIRLAKSASPEIVTCFTSNFQLMSIERAKEFLASGLDILQVSVPGVNKETYQKIMINGDFSKFINNLKGFHTVLKNSPKKLQRFSACVVAMKSNIDELPFIPEFIAGFGITRLAINSLLPFSSEMLKESLLDDDGLIRHSRYIYEKTMRNAERLGIRVGCVLTPEASTSKNDILCRYPIRNFSLSYKGDVSPCWMLDIANGYNCYFGGETHKIPYIKFGNIYDEPISGILDGPEFVAFRRQFTQGDLPGFCRDCPVGKRLICG